MGLLKAAEFSGRHVGASSTQVQQVSMSALLPASACYFLSLSLQSHLTAVLGNKALRFMSSNAGLGLESGKISEVLIGISSDYDGLSNTTPYVDVEQYLVSSGWVCRGLSRG